VQSGVELGFSRLQTVSKWVLSDLFLVSYPANLEIAPDDDYYNACPCIFLFVGSLNLAACSVIIEPSKTVNRI